MSYQVIKQPAGEFAIFSTFTDTIVMWDATAEEVVEYFVGLAADRARRDAERSVQAVASGEPRNIYHQFTMTWERALKSDREHNGEAWAEFTDPPTQDSATIQHDFYPLERDE